MPGRPHGLQAGERQQRALGAEHPAVLAGGTAACLFECGEKGPYERIDLALFPVSFPEGK